MPLPPGYTLVVIPLPSRLEATAFFLWLKRMKELEQQRDALWFGLGMVERARDWYHQEIHQVQQRLRHSSETPGEKEQASMSLVNHPSLLQDKIQHVNCCLSDFISSADRMFLPHCHTGQADPEPLTPRAKVRRSQQQNLEVLKQHNYWLTKEVSRKSQRITQLEHEKAILIKQLLDDQLEGYSYTACDSSTFV
ncbi:suppressor APC domain-containing protein 2-like [Chiloscyllium punctatum]